jgi:hypothetical protein
VKSLEIELTALSERVARENYETNRQHVPGETSWDDLNVSTRRLFARAVKNKIILAAPDIIAATLLWAADEISVAWKYDADAIKLREMAATIEQDGDVILK